MKYKAKPQFRESIQFIESIQFTGDNLEEIGTFLKTNNILEYIFTKDPLIKEGFIINLTYKMYAPDDQDDQDELEPVPFEKGDYFAAEINDYPLYDIIGEVIIINSSRFKEVYERYEE